MGDGEPHPRIRVLVADERGRPVRAPALTRWLARVAPARARGTVHVALVSDRCVRALNRRYLRTDRATDVLSFPAQATPPSRDASWALRRRTPAAPGRRPKPASGTAAMDMLVGDIVIARGVAGRQARAAGHSEAAELRLLALHGLLHLLGYDHEADGGRMQRLERRLRRKGGLRQGLIERSRS
jgi:probable rRNA maturation factor